MNRLLLHSLVFSLLTFSFFGSFTASPLQARQVDAALESGDRVYLFQGNGYHRYVKSGNGYKADAKFRTLPGGWKELPSAFNFGIDAALFYKPSGKKYFFKGDSYVRLSGVTVDEGYPMKLPGGWKGLPKSFHKNIDAAIFRKGHTYFFKGSRYVRFTGTTIDPGYPKDLPGGWDLNDFKGSVDAAAMVQSTSVSYFFKGNDYIRLEDVKLKNKKRYPAKINWGWPDYPIYSPFITMIGTFHSPGADIGRCSSASCEFVVPGHVELGKSNSSKLQTFKWNVNKTPEAHAVRWQVSSKPFPSFSKSSSDLDFPGLIDSGVQTINDGSQFNLNFVELGFRYFFKEKERTGVNATSLPESFYLRIIPMKTPASDNIAGNPSETVTIYWPGKAPPPPDFVIQEDENTVSKPLFSASITNFELPTFRDANRWGCVTVKGYEDFVIAVIKSSYPIGKTYCPESYRGDSGKVETFDEFIDWALESFDWVGDRYDDLFELATKVLMEVSFCNAVADAADDAGATGGSAVCKVVATAAVKIGAAALGLPPTIPSYNELVDKGINYAVELAAEEIESRTGIPCSIGCEDLLDAAFSEMASGLKRASPQAACVDPTEAHKHGREPLCMPAGVIVKPAKGAVTTLPFMSFQVKRRAQEPTPSFAGHPECSVTAGMTFKRSYAAGTVIGHWGRSLEIEAQTISARLYDFQTFSLDKYADDDFLLDVNITLQARPFEYPWSRKMYRSSQFLPAGLFHPYGLDWMSHVWGSTAHVILSGDCLDEDVEMEIDMETWADRKY